MPEETKNGMSIDKQVEEAKAIFNRMSNWISNCDAKTGTVLGLIGVILTILMTNEGFMACYKITTRAIHARTFSDILYLLLLFGSITCLLFGMYKLVSVLFASIDNKNYKQAQLELNSHVYFGSIGARPTYQEYKESFTGMTRAEYLNDLLSQIYINSLIANKKFNKYNQGLKFAIIGLIWFIAMLVIGIFLYM